MEKRLPENGRPEGCNSRQGLKKIITNTVLTGPNVSRPNKTPAVISIRIVQIYFGVNINRYCLCFSTTRQIIPASSNLYPSSKNAGQYPLIGETT